MPRGVPLSPEQLAQAAAEYARTGSYAAAGRAIDADESVARRALLRAGESERVALHTRAVDRGLREGRKGLRECIAKARSLLAQEVEPRDVASLSQALSHSMQRLTDLKEGPARRSKLRAETRVADAKAKGLLPPESVTMVVTDPARVDEIFRSTFGFAGAKEASSDAQPGDGVSNVGSEALPVPTPMDRRGE